MSTADDLLHAIAENPDDDALRLVYADSLEEAGDAERAAFVRAQLEWAKEPEHRGATPAWRRQDAIWRRNRESWLAEVPAWARPQAAWRRGVPHRTGCTVLNFVKYGRALLRRHPTFASFWFMNAAGRWPRLAGRTALGLIREIACFQQMTLEALQALVASPHAGRLEALTATNGGLDATACAVLGRPGALPSLTRLDLMHNALGAAGAAALTAGGLLRLVSLGLHNTGLSADGVERLPALPCWARLTSLDLGGNAIGAAGLNTLLRRPPSSVEVLDLQDNGLTPAVVAELVASAALPRLVHLNLADNRLGAAGVTSLLSRRKPLVARLTDLSLAENRLDDAAVGRLAASPLLANLRWIDLRINPWGDAAAAALVGSPHLRDGLVIRASHTDLTEAGRRALSERFTVTD